MAHPLLGLEPDSTTLGAEMLDEKNTLYTYSTRRFRPINLSEISRLD